MNFRAIDPREERSGMSGASETDRRVWAEFYDATAGDLHHEELEREFSRLWQIAGETASPPTEASNGEVMLHAEAKRLATSGLEALLARYKKDVEARPSRPNTKSTSTRIYERSALVVAIAKLRAGNRCEVPDCKHPTFLDEDGITYSEVHHIEPLSEGGQDVLENVACLCPAHHREVHLGQRASELIAAVRVIRLR
jgi:hypothetical protein